MVLLVPLVFISGILTAFSPCVLPILPIVFASGVDGNKKRVNGVILGLVLSFSLGVLLLPLVVSFFGLSADTVRTFAVVVLAIFGVILALDFWDKIQFRLESLFSGRLAVKQGGGFGSGFVAGIALGITWTPCVGPIIAAVSTLVAVSEVSVATVVLALVYGLGIGLPLWIISVKGGGVVGKLGVFKSNPGLVRRVFGVILVFTGLFIYSGADRAFQTWTLDNLPESWTQFATTFEDKFEIKEDLSRLLDR